LFGQAVSIQTDRSGRESQTRNRLQVLLDRKNPGVEATDTLAEAGRKVLGYHFAEMVRHEEGTRSGEDIEELHDMRVATRRMRAAFEVFAGGFKPKAIDPYLKGLRATGRALGRVRDLDVFMEKARQYLESLPEEARGGLDPLLEAWRKEREKGRGEMLAHLNSEDYTVFKRRFLVFLTTPGEGASRAVPPTPQLVREVLPVLVYTRLGAVRAFAPVLDSATLDQLHALRIEFKKLRYTLEFFREVLGGEARGLIEEIKALQDHLGDLNDADVACQILRDFLDEWENRQLMVPIDEREDPEPIVAYLATRHAERHRLVVTFREAWARFDRPEVRARFAAAVAVL
jgi:CHAD domain-containing protein